MSGLPFGVEPLVWGPGEALFDLAFFAEFDKSSSGAGRFRPLVCLPVISAVEEGRDLDRAYRERLKIGKLVIRSRNMDSLAAEQSEVICFGVKP